MGVVCSTATDGHEYYALTTVAASTIKDIPLSSVSIQHREALRLLVHVQQNIGALAGGVASKKQRKSADRVPLVRKHGDREMCHRLQLLWILECLSQSLLIPEDLSNSECSRTFPLISAKKMTESPFFGCELL